MKAFWNKRFHASLWFEWKAVTHECHKLKSHVSRLKILSRMISRRQLPRFPVWCVDKNQFSVAWFMHDGACHMICILLFLQEKVM